MSTVKVEKITEPCVLGEGPHWDVDKKVLYFVDVGRKVVHKYDPASSTIKTVNFDEAVSFIIPVKDKADKFVVGLRRKVALMTWDGESSKPSAMEVVASLDGVDGDQGCNINDAKADAAGTLWSGTMGPLVNDEFVPGKGIFFSISKDRNIKKHLSGIGLSNGITWSLDNKTMYYIDSLARKVDAFDFDITEGKIGNKRTAFDFEEQGLEGGPDGQTTDTDGNLWVASFGDNQVIKVDPTTGKLLQRVEIPAKSVTSVTWGGERLDELFVTTATIRTSADELQRLPMAGCTFRVTGLGARGLPAHSVVL